MKRYLTYLMLLMAVLACQKNEDIYTPVLTTVQIELGTAEAVSKSPAKAAAVMAAVSAGHTLDITEITPAPPMDITGTICSSFPDQM